MSGQNYREQIENIKLSFNQGILTYDEMVAKVTPLVAEINKEIAAIAKKHGKRATKLSISYILR